MSKAFKVTFSNFEKKWICSWASDSIYESNHWGDGVSFLKEEDSLIAKLQSTQNNVILYKNEIRQIYAWLVARIGDGSVLIGEDMVVGRKILELYEKTFDDKSAEFLKLKKIIGE